MNNFLFKLKKGLQNRNTVTIIGVLLVLGLLYLGYNSQVKDAVKPILVPVASQKIQPRTLITPNMITTIEVPNISVSTNVILLSSLIVGKYTNVNAFIPQGSMFFTDAIVDKSELPDYAFSELETDEIPVFMKVDLDATYGNSIYPGNTVDIYMKGEEDGKVFVGKFIENVKILSVKDGSGKPVFENTDQDRTPSSIIYGVKENIFLLLLKASYIQNVDLLLIPHGGIGVEPGETQVSLEYLKNYIESQTVNIDPSTER